MEKFIIRIKDIAEISIYTDIEEIAKKLKERPELINKTIPSEVEYIGKETNIKEKENYIVVNSYYKKIINLNKNQNIAYMFSPDNEFFFPDLVYLTIGMFSNILQRKKSYFIQSSVVKYDDKHSIMILGDPNAGKTSMAYYLMKNYGFKLISNDNAIVKYDDIDNKLKTICGTKSVQMRYGGIKLFFPEILPFINVDSEDEGRNEWDIKIYIDDYLKKNNFEYCDESIITNIYNINTFKTKNSFIREREKIDEILLIYEHLTKQIRSSRYALVGYNYPLPSFEEERYLQERFDISKKICESAKIYDARGDISDISKKLVKKL